MRETEDERIAREAQEKQLTFCAFTRNERLALKKDKAPEKARSTLPHQKHSWRVNANGLGRSLLAILEHEYAEQERTTKSRHRFSYAGKNCGILLNIAINHALQYGYTFQLCETQSEFHDVEMKECVLYFARSDDGESLNFKAMPTREATLCVEGNIFGEEIDFLMPRGWTLARLLEEKNFTADTISEYFSAIFRIISAKHPIISPTRSGNDVLEVDTATIEYLRKFHMGKWYYLIATSQPTAMMLLSTASIYYIAFILIELKKQFIRMYPDSSQDAMIFISMEHRGRPLIAAFFFHAIITLSFLGTYAIPSIFRGWKEGAYSRY